MPINPSEVGYWEGDTFVFNEPFDMGEGRMPALRISVAPEALSPGISKEDAVYAFLNGVENPEDTSEWN